MFLGQGTAMPKKKKQQSVQLVAIQCRSVYLVAFRSSLQEQEEQLTGEKTLKPQKEGVPHILT